MRPQDIDIDEYNGETRSFWSGGVEYRGTIVNVFFHPTEMIWKAKCAYHNEPTSFFYQKL